MKFRTDPPDPGVPVSGDTWLALPLAQQHGCGEPGAKDEDTPEPSEGQIGHYQRVRGLVRGERLPGDYDFSGRGARNDCHPQAGLRLPRHGVTT